MKRTPVKSSNIASVGYDPKQRLLELEFKNQRVYQYKGVEPAVHDDLLHAPSAGQFFFERIRSQYSETEVTQLVNETMEGNAS